MKKLDIFQGKNIDIFDYKGTYNGTYNVSRAQR